MTTRRVAGVVLLVIGAALFVIGMNASDSVADQLSDMFTGSYTDKTMWYLVIGVASAVGGLLLLAFPRGRSLA